MRACVLALVCLWGLVEAQVRSGAVTLNSANPQITMSYTADLTNDNITMTITSDQGSVWLAAGPSPSGAMAGSDVFICSLKTVSNGLQALVVGRYSLTAESFSGITLSNSAGSGSCTQANGQTTMTVWRPLSAGGGVSINFALDQIWVATVGTGNGLSSSTQHASNPVPMNVNLATQTVSVALDATWKLAHGAFMLLSWGVMLPVGSFFPRYFRSIGDGTSTWFKYHQITQWVGMLFQTIGFFVAVGAVGQPGFYNGHMKFGLAIWLLSWVQPVGAFFRPHAPEGNAEKTKNRKYWELAHHWMGRILLFFGMINIYVGIGILIADGSPQKAFYGCYVLIWLFLVVFIAVNEYKRWKNGQCCGPRKVVTAATGNS